MNLNVSGHHVEVTPAIRSYVRSKIERVTRHFDHVIDAHVILTVDKTRQKAEVTLQTIMGRRLTVTGSTLRPQGFALRERGERPLRRDRPPRRQAGQAGSALQG